MGHQRQYKADTSYTQKRRQKVAESHEWERPETHDPFMLSPDNILNLQRTIGNQAVQRLIRHADTLQRQPTVGADAGQPTNTGEKQASSPSVLANITGKDQGKFKGGSRIAGHEGKIEILSLSFAQPGGPSQSREPDGEKTISVQLVKQVDDSSVAFMKASVNGEQITVAQFDFIRRNEQGNVETVQTFEFTNGYVTSYQVSGSGSVPTESITIEFKVKPEKK